MPAIRLEDARVTSTPNATMHTYAGPTTGGTGVAVWRTELPAGSSGPLHAISRDHVLVVLAGAVHVETEEGSSLLGVGDGFLLPAGVQRRITNPDPDVVAVTLTAATAGSTARVGDGDPVPVPWAA